MLALHGSFCHPSHRAPSSVSLAPIARASLCRLLVRAAVTGDAVLEVLDAFLLMFNTYLVRLVFMASVAGVALEVIARVASHAGCVVVLVEHKELAVLEGGDCGAEASVTSVWLRLSIQTAPADPRLLTSQARLPAMPGRVIPIVARHGRRLSQSFHQTAPYFITFVSVAE